MHAIATLATTTVTLYNVVDPSVPTSLPFSVPSPSVTIQAIGTALNGETTYAVEEVESVFVDAGIPSTYTTDPVTVYATIVEDATHKVVDLTYPTTGLSNGASLHEHESCTFDENGTGTCADVFEEVAPGGSSSTTFTISGTGTMTGFYTITATGAVTTDTTSAKANAALPSGPRLISRESCIGWGFFAVGALSSWALLL
ncbi:hypothetical protein H0H93_000874 [Arthromyces matolae]|nr:hypothetical protein H0H93_000874 [Arthromyces matolae]